MAGVYSHGLNRFPRVVEYLKKGEIDPKVKAEKIMGFGAFERWDGHRGFGPLNAKLAMDRAVELAKEFGMGIVALGNNNHWMRGGSYGWQELTMEPADGYRITMAGGTHIPQEAIRLTAGNRSMGHGTISIPPVIARLAG